MNILRKIDAFLNTITMYRLVMYSLMILASVGIANSFLGNISLSGVGLLISLAVVCTVSFVAYLVMPRLWQVPASYESWFITALILFCILPPVTTVSRGLAVALAALVAGVSKYIIALHRKHIFNPAAFGVVFVGLLELVHATWWIGSAAMLPFTLVLGLLIVRKLRRFYMFGTFVVAALFMLLLVGWLNDRSLSTVLSQAILSGPLIFLGTIMLPEPSTTPPRVKQQMVYGVIVGLVFTAQLNWGPLSTTPEIALLIGNVFAYAVSPKAKVRLKLTEKRQLSAQVYDFVFEPERPLNHLPGQYMEWTMAVPQCDTRGNRRTFTIASSPTENVVHLGVKFYEPSSTFKKVLKSLEPGAYIQGGQLAGSFTLPEASRKLVCIAGGIGITPFRSMLKYIVDRKEHRDIVLFYVVSKAEEVSYRDVLQQAETYGVHTIPVLSSDTIPADWQGETGFLTKEMIQDAVPDYAQRTFYLSGPNAMVEHYRDVVRAMKIPRRQIRTDHFSGY
jgi:ferredoxin-NADP reductase/Na+-translocating ferredoxin:NAD+ oxidoreductase RnfD subunit